MAQIKVLPLIRHVRSESNQHLLHFRRGRMVRNGRGLAFWFSPLSSSLVEVPCDDQEVPFLIRARSSDFQEVIVQGSVIYRVSDHQVLATRVDFTIDSSGGLHVESPLDRIAEIFTHLAEEIGSGYAAITVLRTALVEGQAEIRERLEAGLFKKPSLLEMGIEVVAVHISQVTPSADLEKALQVPAREAIQHRSDEATFERRALAVESERAIRENELKNRIELARREEELIAQEGRNARSRAEESAEAAAIEVRAETDHDRLRATAKAEAIAAVEGARVNAERDRMEIYRDLPPQALMGLAAREFAGKLRSIDRIQITPDGISSLLTDLVEAGTRLTQGKSKRAGTRNGN